VASALQPIIRGSIGMTDPAVSFEPHRRRLLGLAYRMLGSIADAEDAVQDAYLRWHAADRDVVLDSRAYLTTTTMRICLDLLKSARARRESYVGPWLPEPVLDTAALAPDTQTELAEDLSIALLLALDRLSPLERAAFLLHDVFDCSFSEVASALDRSEAACRQLASRARTHVREARPKAASTWRDRPGPSSHEQLMSAFVNAAKSGDLETLMSMLATDARLVTDGGGKVPAALNVIEGADHVARFAIGVTRKGLPEGSITRSATINGLPGLISYVPGGSVLTVAFDIVDDRIRGIYGVSNPEKLSHVPRG
jgi:RNA polymerase sigma-70 factor (ECF subfamily)